MDKEPQNTALKANMERLMGDRSIETIRTEMAEAGLPIGTETLHRAKLGKTGNRLQSLEKIAAFFGVTADQLLQPDLGTDSSDWPFSDELRELVSGLAIEELHGLEGAMWAHLKRQAPASLYSFDIGNSPNPQDVRIFMRESKPIPPVRKRRAA